MKRYIFFDKKTGQILHTHQVYKMGSEELQEVPAEELKRMVRRIVDPARADSVITDIPVQSSVKVSLHVNPKTRRVLITKLPRDLKAKGPRPGLPAKEVGKGGV